MPISWLGGVPIVPRPTLCTGRRPRLLTSLQRWLCSTYPTTAALCALALFDGVTRFGGFASVHRLVRSVRVSHHPRGASSTADSHAAVVTATVLYPATVHCLVRSAVIAVMLRTNGIAADLVIGCRQLPFAAHAWVEVDGHPLDESARTLSCYIELDRL